MKLYLSSRTSHNCDEAKQYLNDWISHHGAEVAMITDGRDFSGTERLIIERGAL